VTRIAVLGGSTPFAVPLVDEIAAVAVASARLALHGRDPRALAAVAGYADARLAERGWDVEGTTSLDAVLDGADVVVHQIRYGGLDGRADDERFAEHLGVPADETLGPGGLRSALRAAPPLLELAAALRARAPGALVLNLGNPLSVTTSLLAGAGVRVWGLCELPLATADTVQELLGLDDALEWSYTGLNHRGFLHDLRVDGEDVLPHLTAALPDRARLGVTGDEIAGLGALPLKYFGLFAGHAPHGSGRSAEVARIRAAALGELERDPTVSPPSLAARRMPWYARSVAPVLAAIVCGGATDTVVNVAAADGIVHEGRARVEGSDVVFADPVEPPASVRTWLERFLAHERAVLRAVAEPSFESVLAACAADPLLPEPAAAEAARLLIPA
jgi:6-phospho-beta-glucosidase